MQKVLYVNGVKFDCTGNLRSDPSFVNEKFGSNSVYYNNKQLLLTDDNWNNASVLIPNEDGCGNTKTLLIIELNYKNSRLYLRNSVFIDGVITCSIMRDTIPNDIYFYILIDEALSSAHDREGNKVISYEVNSLYDIPVLDPTCCGTSLTRPVSAKHPGLYTFIGNVQDLIRRIYICSIYDKGTMGMVIRDLNDIMPRVFTNMVARYLTRIFPPLT